jgi:hypothetical protein
VRNDKKRASTSRLKNIWEEKVVEIHNLKVKEKSREKGRVNRGRRRPEYAHRRQIEPGFCGVQARIVSTVWHSQAAHHILISYL